MKKKYFRGMTFGCPFLQVITQTEARCEDATTTDNLKDKNDAMEVFRALGTVGRYMFTDKGWYPYSSTYASLSLVVLVILFVFDLSPTVIDGLIWSVKGYTHRDGSRNLAFKAQIGVRLILTSLKSVTMLVVDVLLAAVLPLLVPVFILCLGGYYARMIVFASMSGMDWVSERWKRKRHVAAPTERRDDPSTRTEHVSSSTPPRLPSPPAETSTDDTYQKYDAFHSPLTRPTEGFA